MDKYAPHGGTSANDKTVLPKSAERGFDMMNFTNNELMLFFLCPVFSDRVGSSGCAMMTPPYGQNFGNENVTVPPWREAVTFCVLSTDINCW